MDGATWSYAFIDYGVPRRCSHHDTTPIVGRLLEVSEEGDSPICPKLFGMPTPQVWNSGQSWFTPVRADSIKNFNGYIYGLYLGLPKSRGKDMIMVVVDRLTK